ncbi:hypothetical protein PR048_013416 [Dryococelus australis]|uniref:Uncharacterized protein n=1 Tax=Dryococelus australis TaxID=614101 RepID=A0ABQ9HSA6_9NEOP|nr:hypothetical protein PR048_013416 [Dryococelus australis]
MPLVGGFSRGSPVFPAPPYSPHYALNGAQDLDVKSLLNLPILFTNMSLCFFHDYFTTFLLTYTLHLGEGKRDRRDSLATTVVDSPPGVFALAPGVDSASTPSGVGHCDSALAHPISIPPGTYIHRGVFACLAPVRLLWLYHCCTQVGRGMHLARGQVVSFRPLCLLGMQVAVHQAFRVCFDSIYWWAW